MARVSREIPAQPRASVRRKSFTGRPTTRDPHEAGNRSTLIGLRLLQVVAAMRGPATLTEIARHARISVSSAYRYLTSLVESRFLAYEPETGKYDLGVAIVELGIAAGARIDALRLATEVMKPLAEQTKLAAILCLWGSEGPTVIKWEVGTLDLAVHTREGLILPLLTTAAGRVFLTYLDEAEVMPLLQQELAGWNSAAPPAKRLNKEKIEAVKREIRKSGLASSVGLRTPIIAGVAAPVFDRRNRIYMALSLIGFVGSFDTDINREPARALKRATEQLSKAMGARLPSEPETK